MSQFHDDRHDEISHGKVLPPGECTHSEHPNAEASASS